MAIDYQHKEYSDNIDKWEMIDNVIDGEDVEQYLIPLNEHDLSDENKARNAAYKKRAVFYQIAGRTAEGLNSLLYSEPPVLTVPPALEYVAENVDGSGVSIYQQSQDLGLDIIGKARGALFTTYPKVNGPLSKADMQTGEFFATIHEIETEQIINWRTEAVGSQIRLSLVVFEEEVEVVQADGDKVESVKQLRELYLESGVFFERKWQKNKEDEWIVIDESMPTDGAGNPWDVIPFTFVGAMSNSTDVDNSMMLGLAKLNLAHYRNSADYEDSVWFAGQAQPWMSGVTQTHVDLMKKNEMYVGSRTLLGVPSGESFGFASAEPNPMVRQAMIDKLEGMIGLGARYIQPGGVALTASQSNNDKAVQHSALSIISGNIGSAYTQALKWAARYMSAPDDNIVFQPKSDFIQNDATAQDIQAIIAGYVQGAIPLSDYFNWLKDHNIVDSEKTIEAFSAEVGTASMPDLGA